MLVSWLTPFINEKRLACGAVLQAEQDSNGQPEWIPIPLEPELIEDILKRGPVWLVEQLPDSFPAFEDMEQAEQALFDMFQLHQAGHMTIGAMYALVVAYGGDWRDKSEYGYELSGKTTRRI